MNLGDLDRPRDACGTGFVAHLKGEKSRAIVEQGLELLRRLSHRAAVGADPETGDGSGILLQLPEPFLRAEGARLGFDLPANRRFAVGNLFLRGARSSGRRARRSSRPSCARRASASSAGATCRSRWRTSARPRAP